MLPLDGVMASMVYFIWNQQDLIIHMIQVKCHNYWSFWQHRSILIKAPPAKIYMERTARTSFSKILFFGKSKKNK